jgi:hypothetical protein
VGNELDLTAPASASSVAGSLSSSLSRTLRSWKLYVGRSGPLCFTINHSKDCFRYASNESSVQQELQFPVATASNNVSISSETSQAQIIQVLLRVYSVTAPKSYLQQQRSLQWRQLRLIPHQQMQNGSNSWICLEKTYVIYGEMMDPHPSYQGDQRKQSIGGRPLPLHHYQAQGLHCGSLAANYQLSAIPGRCS